MNDYEIKIRFSELYNKISEVKRTIDTMMSILKPEEDLWDNSDLIRNWKISERTLSYWRKQGIIGFVKMNGKIWYPRFVREEFIKKNLIPGSAYAG